MTLDQQPPSTHWVLDKRIPLAVVVTIILQTAGMVWWAANLSNRVSNLEQTSTNERDRGDRLIRLETQQEAVKETLGTINRKLDRVIERLPATP